DTPADVPAEAHARALDAGFFTPSADDRLVTLELAPGARWVADYYPTEAVAERPDGGLTVSLRARDDAWVQRLALGLAGLGRVTDPPEVAAAVRSEALEVLTSYESARK